VTYLGTPRKEKHHPGIKPGAWSWDGGRGNGRSGKKTGGLSGNWGLLDQRRNGWATFGCKLGGGLEGNEEPLEKGEERKRGTQNFET